MSGSHSIIRLIASAVALVSCALEILSAEFPEARPGWQMKLVAQAPDIRHPSVVCTAPDGRVFVAEDPMDISAPADSTQGRIICFHPDGHRSVFADKLHAVFGMQYLEGKLYVLHNPRFSVYSDGGERGEDREELIESTNPNPWALDWNDHVPANFKLAMDGYFYVAVGDKGIYHARGRDGKEVSLHGGGILRVRPDGTALEVFCRGVRNILDVGLTENDSIFTYDNTDEHDWMGRFTHMVDGGFYGYPHDFVPRRKYTLWMMADFGAGAATGVFANTEHVLPAEFDDNLFLADFSKRQIIRVRIERAGATFKVAQHEEMFLKVPEDFRPVGITLGIDGKTIWICDWQHRDVKENVTVGRLWSMTWTGTTNPQSRPAWYVATASGKANSANLPELVANLSNPSKSVRMAVQRELSKRAKADVKETKGIIQQLREVLKNTKSAKLARIHAIWALDAIDEVRAARNDIMTLARDESRTNVELQRQAIRQLGARHITEAAKPIREILAKTLRAEIRFEAATALGRIGDSNSIEILQRDLSNTDEWVRYAAFTALNRIGVHNGNSSVWTLIIRGFTNEDIMVREDTGFAVRETYDVELAKALANMSRDRRFPESGREAALRSLTELHHQYPEWKGEWGAYHPALAPPPVKNVEWSATREIQDQIRNAVMDVSPVIRLAGVEGIHSAMDTNALSLLRSRFNREPDAAVRRAMLDTLGEFRDKDFRGQLTAYIDHGEDVPEVIEAAIDAAGKIGGDEVLGALLTFAGRENFSRFHARLIQSLGELRNRQAVPWLKTVIATEALTNQIESVNALKEIGGNDAGIALMDAVTNSVVEVRRAAIHALGQLKHNDAIPVLLEAWKRNETSQEAMEALSRMSDAGLADVYLAALATANPVLRERAHKSMGPIRDSILPEIETRVPSLGANVISGLRKVYEKHSVAMRGPIFSNQRSAPQIGDYEKFALNRAGDAVKGQRTFFDEAGVGCIKCHVVAGIGGTLGPDLTLIGAQFARAALIEHVLYPSRVVREGYFQTIIDLKNGESVAGIVKGEMSDAVTIADASAKLQTIPKKEIARRDFGSLSVMPEGLQAGLSLEQFSDLIAYLESRRSDPRQRGGIAATMPAGFRPLLGERWEQNWKLEGSQNAHWKLNDGVLAHDGKGEHLWTREEFGDFVLRLEWRWPGKPVSEDFPLIDENGDEVHGPDGKAKTERVLDGGDSGIFVRGFPKAQANLFCYPVGSGEVWDYRTDPKMTKEMKKAVTPKKARDNPVGDWNVMEVRMEADRMTVVLNGDVVIENARLPGLPARGPIGLQKEHGPIEFQNLFIRDLTR